MRFSSAGAGAGAGVGDDNNFTENNLYIITRNSELIGTKPKDCKIVYWDGETTFYKNRVLHNDNGPAIISGAESTRPGEVFHYLYGIYQDKD